MRTRVETLPMSKSIQYSLILSFSYVLIASLYILTSSYIAGSHSASVEQLSQIELFKGIFFIIMTGMSLFFLSQFFLKRITRQDNQITSQIQIISDQKQMIANSERRALSGTFAASIAHDINNIISFIDFNISELKGNQDISKTASSTITNIETAFDRIMEMSRRLMAIGKADVRSTLSTFNICTLIKNTIQIAQMHTGIRKCELSFKSELQDILVQSNPHVIEQCIINLLLNASEAITDNGKIEIHCNADQNDIYVEVHDNGQGIPKDKQDLVFSAFFTTKQNGNGLGLAGVKASIEILSGTVSVADSPLGGALFRIALPRISVGNNSSDANSGA